MTEIPDLRASLSGIFTWKEVSPEQWLDFKVLRRDIERLQKLVRSANQEISSPQIVQTIQRFRETRKIASAVELNHLCSGIGYMDEQKWCILIDGELWRTVTRSIADQKQPRRVLRCYRGLLMNYWAFPVDEFESDSGHIRGWIELRTWLDDHVNAFSRPSDHEPEWLRKLRMHAELLSDNPCRLYAHSFLDKDRTAFNDIVSTLFIPDSSWIHRELILAPVRHVVNLPDEKFQSKLEQVVDVILNEPAIVKYPRMRMQSTAMLLSRYSQGDSPVQHAGLQSLALQLIGNPWTNRPTWDANVQDSYGRPDDNARKMVDSWLKLRLIHDFFELLIHDFSSDTQRLKYWLTFEPLIDSMWFGLSAVVRRDTSSKFNEFRRNANGRMLSVRGGGNTNNNAFLMKIGKVLVIEYGLTGNACFVYLWDRLPKVFRDALDDPNSAREWEVDDFKKLPYIERLRHFSGWQERFDDAFVRLIGPHVRDRSPIRKLS